MVLNTEKKDEMEWVWKYVIACIHTSHENMGKCIYLYKYICK